MKEKKGFVKKVCLQNSTCRRERELSVMFILHHIFRWSHDFRLHELNENNFALTSADLMRWTA